MSTLTKEQMDGLPRMVADAIPGPWKADKHPAFGSIYVRDDPVQWNGRGRLYVADVNGARPLGDATARLIALAPTLAATVIEQQTEIERLRGALKRCLNFIENTESELGIALDSGDAARAVLEVKP